MVSNSTTYPLQSFDGDLQMKNCQENDNGYVHLHCKCNVATFLVFTIESGPIKGRSKNYILEV